ncbi:hypothetical protein [Streptosporangium sp. NPDC004631]
MPDLPDAAVEAAAIAVASHPWDTTPRSAHQDHVHDAGCAVCQGDVPAIVAVALKAAAPLIAAQARRDVAERALNGGLPADMDECRIIARYRRQGRQDAGEDIADLIEHVVGEHPGNGIPRPVNDQGQPLTDLEWAAWLARNAYPKEPKARA